MSFYISDDLREASLQAKKNPSAQYVGKWCDAYAVDELVGEGEKCPVCEAPISRLKWLEPHKIRLSNTRYPDRLAWWIKDPMIISERVKSVFEDEQLLGIKEFIPVTVTKVARIKANSAKPPQYFSAEINYSLNVRVDVTRSKIIGQKDNRPCMLCNPFKSTRSQIIKISLDTSSWQGEDIFKVFSLGVVFSQKFYNLVQKHNLTNFNLVPIEEYQRG